MPWINDVEYRYTAGILKAIASCYLNLYDDGLSIKSWRPEFTVDWQLAEYKTDFDRSLQGIGRGKWEGARDNKLTKYKGFGRLQRIVIADILRLPDESLNSFRDLSRLRGYAYSQMARFLNGKPLWGAKAITYKTP